MDPLIQKAAYEHQDDDLVRLRMAMAEPGASVLYVAFMGSGKTVVAARLISEWLDAGERVLVLTHRRVLIGQTDRRLRDCGITSDRIGWIWGTHPRTNADAPIQVASIDTLIRRDAPADITRIVIDEAHHVAAGKWRRVLAWYLGVPRLGLTATPERLDGRPLGDFFTMMVESAPVTALIEAGTVRKPEVWTRPDGLGPDMSGAPRRGGDWAEDAAERAMATLVGDIPAHWLKRADGRPTVGFAPTVRQAKLNVKRFRAAGIKSELLTGGASDGERDEILERLRTGKTRVVWTCDVLSEGWDYKGARCAILARPTCSLARYLQWCGRVMRAGDVMPVILDHAGNYLLHGMPYRDQQWDLHARRDSRPALVVVERDGHVRDMTPSEAEGELRKVTADILNAPCEAPGCLRPAAYRSARNRARRGTRAFCEEHRGYREPLPTKRCGAAGCEATWEAHQSNLRRYCAAHTVARHAKETCCFPGCSQILSYKQSFLVRKGKRAYCGEHRRGPYAKRSRRQCTAPGCEQLVVMGSDGRQCMYCEAHSYGKGVHAWAKRRAHSAGKSPPEGSGQ